MFGITHSPVQKKRVALFDIGSGSVGSATAEIVHGKPARILSSRRTLLSHAERDEQQRLAAISKLLFEEADEVFTSAASTGGIAEVHAVIHAPWSQSMTATRSRQFEKPTLITKDIVQLLAKEAAKEKIDLPCCQYESVIVRVELNGYPTAHPEGKMAEEVAVTILRSSMPEVLEWTIDKMVGTYVPERAIRRHSSTLSISKTLNDISARSEHFTVIDVASEASTCLAIRAGAITRSAVVPAGTRELLSGAAKKAKTTPEELISLIRMAAEGVCDTETCNAVAEALVKSEEALMRQFGEIFTDLAKQRKLPNTAVVVINPDLASWAASFFSRLDFSQFTETGKPFTVKRLAPRTLVAKVVYAPEASPDAGISTAAALIQSTGS